ncbi:hypothetical protein pb186bvf_008559 [Paramecium bursaria]
MRSQSIIGDLHDQHQRIMQDLVIYTQDRIFQDGLSAVTQQVPIILQYIILILYNI